MFAGDVNASFHALSGNLGAVRAFDTGAGIVYTLLLGTRDDDPEGTHVLFLAQIDVEAGVVLHATAIHGDKGCAPSDEVFMQLAYAQ